MRTTSSSRTSSSELEHSYSGRTTVSRTCVPILYNTHVSTFCARNGREYTHTRMRTTVTKSAQKRNRTAPIQLLLPHGQHTAHHSPHPRTLPYTHLFVCCHEGCVCMHDGVCARECVPADIRAQVSKAKQQLNRSQPTITQFQPNLDYNHQLS